MGEEICKTLKKFEEKSEGSEKMERKSVKNVKGNETVFAGSHVLKRIKGSLASANWFRICEIRTECTLKKKGLFASAKGFRKCEIPSE